MIKNLMQETHEPLQIKALTSAWLPAALAALLAERRQHFSQKKAPRSPQMIIETAEH